MPVGSFTLRRLPLKFRPTMKKVELVIIGGASG
jgi:hypothetical protein